MDKALALLLIWSAITTVQVVINSYPSGLKSGLINSLIDQSILGAIIVFVIALNWALKTLSA